MHGRGDWNSKRKLRARICLNMTVKCMLKMSKQWTKPVKKTVIMKNKVEDGSMEDIIVVILKNDCSNKEN